MKRKPLFVGLAAVMMVGFIALAIFAARLNSVFGFVGPSLNSRLSDYQTIVADIKSGAISADASGACTLPSVFDGVTPRGLVYTGTTPTGTTVVLFPTWYGRGSDVDGYIHSSAPLVAGDYYTINWGSGGNAQHLDVGSIDMLSVSAVRGSWYWGSRRLD
jgi:hypothetical protein